MKYSSWLYWFLDDIIYWEVTNFIEHPPQPARPNTDLEDTSAWDFWTGRSLPAKIEPLEDQDLAEKEDEEPMEEPKQRYKKFPPGGW